MKYNGTKAKPQWPSLNLSPIRTLELGEDQKYKVSKLDFGTSRLPNAAWCMPVSCDSTRS